MLFVEEYPERRRRFRHTSTCKVQSRLPRASPG